MKISMILVSVLFLFLGLMSCSFVQRVSNLNPPVVSASSQASTDANFGVATTTFNWTVTLNTTMGIIVIGLFDHMPITSSNFKNLTALGLYDGTIFHRVVQDFVIHCGDIFDEKGTIIPTIPDELPTKHSNIRGSVAMAKTSQPNSATSQFFINVADNTYLDTYGGGYSVFGQVTQGMNVVDNISNVTTDASDRPLQDVTILKATLSQSVPEYSFPVYVILFMVITLLTAIFQRARKTSLMPKRTLHRVSLTCQAIERTTEQIVFSSSRAQGKSCS